MSSYKFDENILELSETDDPEKLHEEWIHMSYNEHVDIPVRCICTHVIYNPHMFLNIKTKKMINLGTTCVKKLRLNKNNSVRSVFLKFINGSRGEYQDICDLIKYSNENWVTFLESIKSKVHSVWDNLIGLTEINKIIKLFSDNSIDCSDLDDIVREIQKRIDEKIQLAHASRIRANKLRIEEDNRIYTDRIRQRRLHEEYQARILNVKREEERRKQDQERTKKLRELAQQEKAKSFIKLKKSDWGIEERKRIKSQIPLCKDCNILQRCRACSDKISVELNTVITNRVDLEFNSKYT